MKKKLVSLLLALMLCLSCALPASAAGGSHFTDVPDDAWYAKAVNALADGGVLNGRGNGIFAPNDPVTLAELSVVLMRLRGMGDEIANDAHWAGNAMQFFSLGVVWPEDYEDDEDYFSKVQYTYAKDYAYRGDAASALGVFAWYDFMNKYEAANPGCSSNDVNDALYGKKNNYDYSIIADRDEYYAIAKNWSVIVGAYYGENGHDFLPDNIDLAYAFGVINGIDKNHTCNATGTLTRAELAQMCYNMGWTTAGCVVYTTISW